MRRGIDLRLVHNNLLLKWADWQEACSLGDTCVGQNANTQSNCCAAPCCVVVVHVVVFVPLALCRCLSFSYHRSRGRLAGSCKTALASIGTCTSC